MNRFSRLRSSGSSIIRTVGVPNIKRKALNSWSAVQDTYFSTKDVFERHKVVFTITTSIASVATAWAGYSLRYLHQAKVDKRLETIENAMKNNHHIQREEVKKIVDTGYVTTAACVATAGTALVVGYGLGVRGGIWYANRRFKREQMKLLGGQLKPRLRWQSLLRRPLARFRGPPDGGSRNSVALQKTATLEPIKNNTSSLAKAC
ncbi:hypothetical protein ACHQM5_025568 [Ranunculus cassubicifolius]